MNLSLHNRIWSERWRIWCRHTDCWWGRGSIISPELRGRYDDYLPFEEFRGSLVSLGERLLPASDWVPAVLKSSSLTSLPDFWAMLPDDFSSKVCFVESELFPLFCALADPPRFGTASGRYPMQLDMLKQRGRAGRLLDLGCGVGLGTLELANYAEEVIGVTSEPLEVWMAEHRRLPHDTAREQQFGLYSQCHAAFRVGYAETYHDAGGYDVIVCNGLAGGRFLNQQEDLERFLENCRSLLADDGILLASNHFHEGEKAGVERLAALAQQNGWSVRGGWHDLTLSLGNRA